MRNLEIRPEEVLILSEWRLSELKKIRYAMDYVTVTMDLSNEKHKEAHDCFTKSFLGWLDFTIENIEGTNG